MEIHLIAASATKRLPGNGGICLFVEDVDAIYLELAQRGAKILSPPQDSAYGIRDFNVLDLDGEQLTFSMARPEK